MLTVKKYEGMAEGVKKGKEGCNASVCVCAPAKACVEVLVLNGA